MGQLKKITLREGSDWTMSEGDLLNLEEETAGAAKFFYVGDDVTLNAFPGVMLAFVVMIFAVPVLTNILTLIPIPSLPSSGYGRLGANYDYDDYYDKEFKGYYDDDESLFAASAPKPMRYRMKNYNKRVKT